MNDDLFLEFKFGSESFPSDLPGSLTILNDFALTGGKRFRPELLMKVGKCFSVAPERVAPFAIVAERIHNATLLHDDVVDESISRRGKPTLNALGENKKAILGGDLLLARALRDLGVARDPAILADMFSVLVELTEGEWLQLEARYHFDVGSRHLNEVARKKTGSLIGWCCSTPARVKGESSSTIKILREVGVLLGVAFQLVDDCQDFDRSSGKPYAQDLKEGQINFVIQDLLDHFPELKSEIKAHFSLNSQLSFSHDLTGKLTSSLSRIFSRAETEIIFASAKIGQMDIAPSIHALLEREVIFPFLKQIQITREKMRA